MSTLLRTLSLPLFLIAGFSGGVEVARVAGEVETVETTAEMEEELRALGYLGGGDE